MLLGGGEKGAHFVSVQTKAKFCVGVCSCCLWLQGWVYIYTCCVGCGSELFRAEKSHHGVMVAH